MGQLPAILDSFHKDLDRTVDLLDLTKAFRDFAGVAEPAGAAWPEASTLHRGAPRVRTDLPILSGSLLLYVCGRFEHFVREIVIDLADDMASNVAKYDDLPEKLRRELRNRTLDVASSPARYGYSESEADGFLAELVSNTASATVGPAGGGAIGISSALLALTEANMRPEVVAEVFRRVNITELWREIGRNTGLKLFLSEPVDSICSKESQRRLNVLMTERNSIAHPTGATTFPDPDQVLGSVSFLRALSTAIVDVVQLSLLAR